MAAMPLSEATQEELRRITRDCMKRSGLSQIDAAHGMGMTVSHLNAVLNGRRPIQLHWAEQITGLTGHRLEIRAVRVPWNERAGIE